MLEYQTISVNAQTANPLEDVIAGYTVPRILHHHRQVHACHGKGWTEFMPEDEGTPPTEPTENDTLPASPASGPDDDAPNRERPLAVYGVLVLGVVTLLVLLSIIYFSSGDRDKPELPICTDITADTATQRVYAGDVKSLMVNYDDNGDPKTGERFGPVQARIEFTNGQCAYLPQGITASASIYQVLGVIDFYNGTTEGSQIEVKTQRAENLPDSLFETPTPEPTETAIPTETPEVTATATEAPTRTPGATASPTATEAPTEEPTTVTGATADDATPEDATPSSSPVASPAA